MRIAICIFKYFPFGGLQRDCLEITKACRDRGHRLTIFTMSWRGPVPDDIDVRIVPTHGWTNHGRANVFSKAALFSIRKERFDVILGFNKMPGLDLYYAGDTCYQARVRQKWHNRLYRMTPRFRRFVALEKAVFDPRSKAEIILLEPPHRDVYVRHYGTPLNRFHVLTPGICPDRKPPPDSIEIRSRTRRQYLQSERNFLLLMVGSSLQGKGFDRTVRAVAALPGELRDQTQLLTVGDERMEPCRRLAAKLGVADRLRMLSPQLEIQQFFLGADLLMHPAYLENTGSVILESLAHGLPVATTDVCGYAKYVSAANAGIVVPSPFRQEVLNQFLGHYLASPAMREASANNGRSYAASINLYGRGDTVAALIESRASVKHHALPSA